MLAYIDAAIGGKTLWGGGAPELGDLRLVEDGGEREGTLVSDRVTTETANEGQSRNGVGEQACQWALTQKRTLSGGGALQGGDLRLLEDGSKRRGALGSDAVVPDTARDGWGHSERAGACQRALTEKRTLSGGGALKVGDHRLLEDGSKRRGALVSNVI